MAGIGRGMSTRAASSGVPVAAAVAAEQLRTCGPLLHLRARSSCPNDVISTCFPSKQGQQLCILPPIVQVNNSETEEGQIKKK